MGKSSKMKQEIEDYYCIVLEEEIFFSYVHKGDTHRIIIHKCKSFEWKSLKTFILNERWKNE